MTIDQSTYDAEFYCRVLRELSAHGAEIARLARRHGDITDPALDDVTRSINRNETLARQIAADPGNTRPVLPRGPRGDAQARIVDRIAAAIPRQRGQIDMDALREDLTDQLEDAELDLDFEDRPIEDIIAEIASDYVLPEPIEPEPTPQEAPHRPALRLIRGGKYGEPSKP